jgi:FkbM family methyltransferase
MSPNSISAGCFVYGDKYLDHDERVLVALVAEGEFFIDVGANIGHLALALAQSSKAQGVSIEANPKTFKILKKNIEINRFESSITPLNYAVDSGGSVNLIIQDSYSDDCNSIINGDLSSKDGGLFRVEHQGSFLVQSKSLDALAMEYGFPQRVRLLKIDVEGFELNVLKGSVNLLKSTELIYFEYWEKLTLKYGYNHRDLFPLLESAGFCLYFAPLFDLGPPSNWSSLRPIPPDPMLDGNVNLLGINKHLTVNMPFVVN